jgi:hypothetical protein
VAALKLPVRWRVDEQSHATALADETLDTAERLQRLDGAGIGVRAPDRDDVGLGPLGIGMVWGRLTCRSL